MVLQVREAQALRQSLVEERYDAVLRTADLLIGLRGAIAGARSTSRLYDVPAFRVCTLAAVRALSSIDASRCRSVEYRA